MAPCCSISQPYGIHDPYCPERRATVPELAPLYGTTGEDERDSWSAYWDRIEAQIDADEAERAEDTDAL